ncbi:sugar ABC transporter permease [Paenibacillus thiaminolyticus]|uniref:Sugar ABC transporter permease n=1 Tax=Paenibacillus thiaminolyticus TaxID=49283 RepID=A0A3A3GM79_PANTH|nr:ABC transporter permease subunit [Paenibacillus thiaminolyticus]RJG23985.1 sugar ABC transporter permease [Paenibacillus thiaminolyticus]
MSEQWQPEARSSNPAAAAIPVRKSAFVSYLKRSWQLYALFALPLLYVILFKYGPMVGAQIAFKDYNVVKGMWASDWIGFKHFARFFNSYDFWRIMQNTLIISLYSLAVSTPLPVLLALSLNAVRIRWFKNTVQMVSYAPHFISTVVMVGLLLQFLDPRSGMINQFLGLLGVDPIHFMGEMQFFKSVFVWSGIWQHIGFSCIIYLAALSTVDPALHEAAVLDGAGRMKRIWHIDMPAVLPIAMILLILNTGQLLETGFEKIYLMQNPLNLKTSEVIDTYVYKIGLLSEAMNFSYATAIGLFKSVISLLLIVMVNYTARKTGQESLW